MSRTRKVSGRVSQDQLHISDGSRYITQMRAQGWLDYTGLALSLGQVYLLPSGIIAHPDTYEEEGNPPSWTLLDLTPKSDEPQIVIAWEDLQ